jgi:hypothetical protein
MRARVRRSKQDEMTAQSMVDEMPEMSREFLEAETLRVARRCLGCGDLEAVKIARAEPTGSGPAWYPLSSFRRCHLSRPKRPGEALSSGCAIRSPLAA